MPTLADYKRSKGIGGSLDAEELSMEQVKRAPDLLQAIDRYAKNVDGMYFDDDEDRWDYYTTRRRWVDANTIGAGQELNKVMGGYGDKLSQQDLEDLSTMRKYWSKAPTVFERFAEGEVVQPTKDLLENLLYGAIDPATYFGGILGKGVASVAGKTAVATAVDAAVTGGLNALTQATDVELGDQNEIDYWEVAKAGALGGALSLPMSYFNATPARTKELSEADIKLASKQAVGGAAEFARRGIGNSKEGLMGDVKSVRMGDITVPRAPNELDDESFVRQVKLETNKNMSRMSKPFEGQIVKEGNGISFDPILDRVRLGEDVMPTPENIKLISEGLADIPDSSWRSTPVKGKTSEGKDWELPAGDITDHYASRVKGASDLLRCLNG